MKFLVVWRIELALMSRGIVSSILAMPDYARPLEQQGKVIGRYHIVGAHGGAWIYDVASNEELERLLVASPVYNVSKYEVYPLADMAPPIPPAG